jgi:hypothetical protein
MAILALFAAFTLAGCGGGDAQDASLSPSSSTQASPSASTPSSPSPAASPIGVAPIDVDGSLVVVRKEGERWTLWRVSPSKATEERFGELPFEPAHAACSPDQRRIAYLKASWPSRGWRRALAIVDVGTGKVRWPTLRGTGLRAVDAMTWLSSSELLVSGPVPMGHASPEDDRLFVVDVASYELSSFRYLRGTEPSAARAVGEVVYRRLKTLEETEDGPLVREELVLHDVDTGSESTALGADYIIYAAGNAYERPVVSPDARYVLAAETGSDPSVRWDLWSVADGERLWSRSMLRVSPLLGAWDWPGRWLAFWAMPARRWARAIVWVYDVERGRFVRSERLAKGLLVTGRGWSDRGALAVSLRAYTSKPPVDTVLVAKNGSPKAFTLLCSGALPVWVD